ncbi:hypothetical protein [Amycolatopsis sp. MEPSY49]|uniref:hypothetical protein n=1 Tax=Amycolatopsis sp. MEPSY49 TaxID=3151600 RepID=UPI003EF81B14
MAKRKKTVAKEPEWLRERREQERSMLAALSSYGDPLPAIHAIVSSPMGMHRYLSLAPAVRLAVRAAVQDRPPTAPSGGMNELLALSAVRADQLVGLDCAISIDPRLPAVAVFNQRPYRLYPGTLERPVAALRTAELLSKAVDPFLRETYGFGISDYVEVCLRHTEAVVDVLAQSWPEGELPNIEAPPAVSTAEVEAAKSAVEWTPLGSWATDEHRNALRWATVSIGQLRVDVTQGLTGTTFGVALAVAGRRGVRFALPLPYIAEAWEYASHTLAREAAALSDECGKNWLRIARAEVARLLTSLRGAPPSGLVMGPEGPAALMRFGARHILLFAVAAPLGGGEVGAAEKALTAITPGTVLQSGDRSFSLSADAEIVRVVVVAQVGPIFLGVTEDVAMVTLEDLQWMVATCDRADELFAFFFEDVVTKQDVHLIGWEPANTWQFWKANEQALHRAGLPPTTILVEPHQVGGQEWAEAAERGVLERTLAELGLPASRELPALELSDGPVRLLAPDNSVYVLAMLEGQRRVGAFIAERLLGNMPVELREFAHKMVGTVCFVALDSPDAAAAAIREGGYDRLIVTFDFNEDSDESLRATASANEVRLIWNQRLLEQEVERPGFIQERLGSLLSEALSVLPTAGEVVHAFSVAWQQAPRMLVVSAYDAPSQHALNLPSPKSTPLWALSQSRLRLARHLRVTGHQPGRFDRTASRAIELEVVVPWLHAEVSEQFSRFDHLAVLRRAAREIEAVTAARQKEQRQRSNRSQMPTARARDEQAGLSDDHDSKLAGQVAVLATLLELALAADGGGTTTPDDIEWYQLLALARLFVDSTVRCDALLHEMSSEVTTISDRYEVTTEANDDTAIDVGGFADARLRHARGERLPVEQQPAGPTPEEILAIVDPAMLADLACTATTLMSTCVVIGGWPVSDEEPVVEVSLDELYEAVARELEIDLSQAQAAVDALTLSQEGLRAERVQPWKMRARDHRLAARPVVRLDEHTCLLLPWNTGNTGLILAGHLSEGLLPWPGSRIDQSPNLRKAIHQVRLAYTRVLEDQVDAELRRLGFIVRSRIKPEDARTIGLPSLPGEVDHIAARAGGDTLWVIDDKDLAPAFTASEFARNVNQFYDPRKGEVPKLLAKVAVVEANLGKVATALKIPAPHAVVGLFVTRSPVPAAFVLNPQIAFTTLRGLGRTVEGS